MSEVLDFAIMLDIIKKSGSWFSYNGERIGQGKENVKRLLEENPEMAAEIEAKIRAMKDSADVVEEEFEVDSDDDDDFDIRVLEDDE